MAAPGQSDGICNNIESGNCCSDGGTNPETGSQLKENIVPKVRKPYTITKQREKWTDEEHQRFLEALKLYGRGWRQIEEHVGTKSAVQIRSHAQKFFSKVAREPDNCTDGSMQPIVIPPPRPKRKPTHPYPRKSPVLSHPKKSPSPTLSGMEKGNKSPTSVLSAFASDNPGSAVSEQLNGCSSLNSCTTDIQSVGLASSEKENEYAISKSSHEDQKVTLLLKLDPSSREDAATVAAPFTSITLFGKTVLVVDSNKLPSPGGVDFKLVISETGQENHDSGNKKLTLKIDSRQVDADLSLGMGSSCQNSTPSYDRTYSTTMNVPSEERFQGQPGIPERSCTGSNALGSVTEAENWEKSLEPVDSRDKRVSSSEKSTSCIPATGFRPYKRCLLEREVTSPVAASEEHESRRARVCL